MKSVLTKSLKSGSNTASISWTLRLFTLLIWLLVGLCAAYWAFKFVTTKPVEATAALAAPTVVIDSKAVGKLLGATDNIAVKAVNTPASSKFVLFGLASSAGGQGFALIALDGKPAKPYRVGGVVADNLVLKSISKTGVILAASLQAPDGVTLELPGRKPANTAATNNFVNPNTPPVVTSAVVPSPQVPYIPPVLPSAPVAILPSVPPTAAAAAAISRFAPQAGDSMAVGRQPGSNSVAIER